MNLNEIEHFSKVSDYHKLGDVATPNPLEAWIWPVVLGGILTISIADLFSDVLGIHIAEEFDFEITAHNLIN